MKHSEALIKRASGLQHADKEETISLLEPHVLARLDSSIVQLGEVRNVADPDQLIFPQTTVHPSRSISWGFYKDDRSYILRIGSIYTGNKVLQTDFGYPNLLTPDFGGIEIFKDAILRDRRSAFCVDAVIAPWSHYFRREYYMYLIFVVAKICRLKQYIPKSVFSRIFISYPLFKTAFEAEYLELLGFSPDRVIDSRTTKVIAEKYYAGNNDNWMHPDPADIVVLKQTLGPVLRKASSGPLYGKRIYICRSGRRRVENEDELIRMLQKFDFDIIEDIPRTISEQFTIYNNASFLMGPHGSSFANIVWCEPGTHLFELFPPEYVYNYFTYLAQVMGLTYSAYSIGPVSYTFKSDAINDNVLVSVSDIENYLTDFFNQKKLGLVL